jgi:hypothetical protein
VDCDRIEELRAGDQARLTTCGASRTLESTGKTPVGHAGRKLIQTPLGN